MGHPIGRGTWRFVHRESGKHLDVVGHTANECILENTAAFVVAFGELPSWSRLDCWLLSDSVVNAGHRLVGYDRGVMVDERPAALEGSGRA
jgi:hypothetical protein